LTEERRARRREDMRKRYVVHGNGGPPTGAPADLRERLSAQILRTLAADPERFLELLRS
jgi:hypothetical protein